jgi:hypothetical protein
MFHFLQNRTGICCIGSQFTFPKIQKNKTVQEPSRVINLQALAGLIAVPVLELAFQIGIIF